MRVRPRVGILAAVVVVAAVLVAGVTDGFGTGSRFRANMPGLPDGAAAATFWDSPLVDLPGVSVTGVHCHGGVHYELQLGATGPTDDNSCYAAMGMYGNGSQQWGVYFTLPGDRAVYRISENYQPWRYCIGGLIRGTPDQDTGPPSLPC